MNSHSEIFRAMLKFAVQQARMITDDQEALDVKCLYKEFDKQIGRKLTVGEYIQYGDKLYRVLQEHVAQADWTPDISASLFVVIDKEHKGTIEDPIPAQINMEYFNGKYYIENDVLYLCTRDSGIALQFMPSQLVGNYFVVVNEENVEDKVEEEEPKDEVIENEGTEGGEVEEPKDEIEEEGKEEEDVVVAEEGTLENPIVVENYLAGVNYIKDKYYIVNEIVYLCIRSGMLYHDPSALLGNYFEKVN